MNVNPFEAQDAFYRVLVNDEGQHSLWPAFAAAPAGWRVVKEDDTRAACLEFIATNWTDMTPCSSRAPPPS
jgi:MbtH protein